MKNLLNPVFRNPRTTLVLAGIMLLIAAYIPLSSRAARQTSSTQAVTDQKVKKPRYVPGEILVRFKKTSEVIKSVSAELSVVESGRQILVHLERLDAAEIVDGLRLGRVNADDTTLALESLRARPDVLYAEPNYIRQKYSVPNDSRYSELWAMKNTGQSGGTPGADIKAEGAWDITTGDRNIAVAIIDEGINVTHPDLQQNIWRNPGEIAGNGVDDDGNGFIDDINGYDFFHNDGSVYDGPGTNLDGSLIDEHGTHVAGTIGAVGNNGNGVVGVNWQTSLISLKFLGPNGGSSSDLIRAFGYAKTMRDRWINSGGSQGANIRVTNNSYGGTDYSQAESDSIQALATSGILFVAAAGNEGEDNNVVASYPAGYDLPNVISVAATDRGDELINFSNRGSHSVHLGAPGEGILSTIPGNSYGTLSGTSMASPHVAGTALLVLAAHPNFDITRLRSAVLFGGDLNSELDQTTITGRRLNALGSLQNASETDTTAPGNIADFHLDAQVGRNVTLTWTAPGDDGANGTASLYEIRFTDQTSGTKYLLDAQRPSQSGSQEFSNIQIPFRHTAGTVTLTVTDNTGNQSSASLAVAVAQNKADPYTITESAATPLSTGGTHLNASYDDVIYGHGLPFQFPFFDRFASSVYLSSNGTIYIPPRVPSGDPFSSTSLVSGWRMIAGLWDDLDLSTSKRADADIYQVTPDSDRVIFRWQGVPCNFNPVSGCTGGDPVNFEIELRRDGTIIKRYGDGNHGLHPVVGIGGGEPDSYIIDSHTSETSSKDLTNAPTVTYSLRSLPLVPNVTVSSTANPQPVRVGQNFQVNVTLGNSGQEAAAAVELKDIFSPGSTLASCTTTQGICKPPLGNSFTVWIGSIAPGATATVSMLFTADTFPVGGYYFNNTFLSSAAEPTKNGNTQISVVSPNPTPLRGASGVGAGFNHSFALMADGSVLGWGSNYYGELGFENYVGIKPVPTAVPGLFAVTRIDGGYYHSLALKNDGSVWSWGTNYNGQLGDGTTTARAQPAKLNSLSNITAIAAGTIHSLALRSDGTVWAWGANAKGQLGDNSTTDRTSPVQVNNLTNVIAIAAGGDHSLAIKGDGTLWTWGGNDHGQLGDGTTVSKPIPVPVNGLSGVSTISAGDAFSLAAKSDGTVWTWGWNNFGQLGVNVSLFERSTPAQVNGLSLVSSVSAGNGFCAVLKSDGTVWQWGNYVPPNGSFGLDKSIPTPVLWVSGVTSIAAGGTHVVALTQDGTVWAWGDNNFAQLGNGSSGYTRWWAYEVNDFDRPPPPIGEVLSPSFSPDGGTFTSPQNITVRSASADAGIVRPAFGWTFCLMLMTDGTIWASGRNDFGQLGNNDTAGTSALVQTQINSVNAVAAGGAHSMALKQDGTLWVWGSNINGQMGVSPQTLTRQITPVRLTALSDVRAISAGGSHSLVLKNDGTVWAWGWNDQGQVGDGTQTDRYTPVQVLSGVKEISAGIHHNLALKTDGTVWAWGDNRWGEIGDGTADFRRLTPVQVVGLSNIIAVGAGGEYSAALRGDGTVWTWGDNQDGELANGQTDGAKHSLPVQVNSLSNISAIMIGSYHGLARSLDGTTWAWGAGYAGQIGNGNTQNQPVPVQITAAAGASLVVTGANSCFMLKPDGSAWDWGANESGQLGLGNNTNRTTPVQINQPTNGVSIHYTTNGSDPTEGDPLVTSGSSVLVDHSLTLKARAFKNGWAASQIKSAAFQIVPLNPIDDARTFIRQQYLDFLNREPDPGGWDYWTSGITQCGADLLCIHNHRIDVSAAFFIELEFQETGYVVYRIHRAAFGTMPGAPTRANLAFAQFMNDRGQLVAGPGLPQSTLAFANNFVVRPEFKAAYPDTMTSTEFVNKLFDTAGLTPFTQQRQDAITALTNGTKTRAQVILDLIDIPEFKTREYNGAFVLMQYFGYLRRDPDQGGYDFWLDVLNNRVPGNFRGMVCAFLTSAEYQHRFGPTVTRTDHDCGP